MKIADKLKFINRYGKIYRLSNTGEWLFIAAHPACPVLEMRSYSKWKIVTIVYDAIKSYPDL